MTRPATLATAGVAVLLALACTPTRTTLDTPEPTMSHSESAEPTVKHSESAEPAPSTPPVTDTESGIIREILVVTAVVRRYIAAVTAENEGEAARYTCRKSDGSLLWVSAQGRPITLLRVTDINLERLQPPAARVVIQVEGQPESVLTLEMRDGTWCIWP